MNYIVDYKKIWKEKNNMVGIILALDYEIDNSILKKLECETLNNQKFYFRK